MITLITGAPGAGKTAALVSMLSDLGKDRLIYSHGIPDLQVPHVSLDDPALWPDTVPDGAVIIIDEVQTVWRPSGPGQKIPEHIAKLETHRHRGLDFYIITQGPNLVHSNVRALVGRHVHLRDLGILGRWWYEWPETADNCRTGWKNAPVKKRYRLPKHIFGQYKSASLHVKPIRSFPRVLLLLFVVLLFAGYLAYKTYSSISDKIKPPASPAFNQAVNPTAPVRLSAPPPAPPAPPPAAAAMASLTVPQYLIARAPRLPDFPHTAPVYDQVTQPVEAPYPAACVSIRGGCKCYTQQGTVLPAVSKDACLQIVAGGFFVDWKKPERVEQKIVASAPAPSAPTPVQLAQAASLPASLLVASAPPVPTPAPPAQSKNLGYLESLRLRNAEVRSVLR